MTSIYTSDGTVNTGLAGTMNCSEIITDGIFVDSSTLGNLRELAQDGGAGTGVAEMIDIESFINNSDKVRKIESNITGLTTKVNNMNNTLTTLNNLPTRLNALISGMNTLQQNAVTVLNYKDNSVLLTNVYNTQYINSIVTNNIPLVYDDLGKSIAASENTTYSANFIANIPNILSIPRVYADSTKETVVTNTPVVYSVEVIDDILSKTPKYKQNYYNGIDIYKNVSVYTCDYINALQIPSIILAEHNPEPHDFDVYNAKYINNIETRFPKIVNSMEEISNPVGDIYSVNYINSLAIPGSFFSEYDTHYTSSHNSDTSVKNIYNTYYIDRFMDTKQSTTLDGNRVITWMQNNLCLRLYNKDNYKTALTSINYQQLYGNDSRTYMFSPDFNKLSLGYYIGDRNNKDEYSKIEIMTVSQDSTINVKYVVIDNYPAKKYITAETLYSALRNYSELTPAANGYISTRTIEGMIRKTQTDSVNTAVELREIYYKNQSTNPLYVYSISDGDFNNSDGYNDLGYGLLSNTNAWFFHTKDKGYNQLSRNVFSGDMEILKSLTVTNNITTSRNIISNGDGENTFAGSMKVNKDVKFNSNAVIEKKLTVNGDEDNYFNSTIHIEGTLIKDNAYCEALNIVSTKPPDQNCALGIHFGQDNSHTANGVFTGYRQNNSFIMRFDGQNVDNYTFKSDTTLFKAPLNIESGISGASFNVRNVKEAENYTSLNIGSNAYNNSASIRYNKSEHRLEFGLLNDGLMDMLTIDNTNINFNKPTKTFNILRTTDEESATPFTVYNSALATGHNISMKLGKSDAANKSAVLTFTEGGSFDLAVNGYNPLKIGTETITTDQPITTTSSFGIGTFNADATNKRLLRIGADIASGFTVGMQLGKSDNLNNSALMNYYFSASESTNNYLSLGFYGNENILKLTADKNCTLINNLTVSGDKVYVTGSESESQIIFCDNPDNMQKYTMIRSIRPTTNTLNSLEFTASDSDKFPVIKFLQKKITGSGLNTLLLLDENGDTQIPNKLKVFNNIEYFSKTVSKPTLMLGYESKEGNSGGLHFNYVKDNDINNCLELSIHTKGFLYHFYSNRAVFDVPLTVTGATTISGALTLKGLTVTDDAITNNTVNIKMFAPNLTTGKYLALALGRDQSTNNCAYMVYNYNANQGTTNYLGFDLHDTRDILTIASDKVTMNKPTSILNTTANLSSATMFNVLANNLSTEQGYVDMTLGQSLGQYNAGVLSFIYSGKNSTSNCLGLGLWNARNLLKITPSLISLDQKAEIKSSSDLGFGVYRTNCTSGALSYINIGKNNDHQGNRFAVVYTHSTDNNTDNANFGSLYVQGHILKVYNNKCEIVKPLSVTGDITGSAAVNSATLSVSSNASIGGNLSITGVITQSSDGRLKKDIQELNNEDANIVTGLNPVSYRFKNDEKQRLHYGFIAQEVKEIAPELVYEDENGQMSVDYVGVVPLLVAKIKDLEEKVDFLLKHISI